MLQTSLLLLELEQEYSASLSSKKETESFKMLLVSFLLLMLLQSV